MADLLVRIIHNFSLMLVIGYAYYWIEYKLEHLHKRSQSILLGIVFGSVTVAIMVNGIEVVEGVYMDSRVIMLVLSGFFGGPLVAIVAGAIVGFYRYQLGGDGMLVGIITIVIATLTGIFFYYIQVKFDSRRKVINIMGASMILIALFPMMIFSKPVGKAMLEMVLEPWVVTYIIGAFIFSMVLTQTEKHIRMVREVISMNECLEEKVVSRTKQIEDINEGLIEEIRARKETEEALKQAEQQAIGANKMKSDFLANMSHEIRTPLNAIIGYTHLLSKTDLSEKQGNFLSKMASSSENLLGIVNDILDFSKIEAGKVELIMNSINIYDLINRLLDTVTYSMLDKQLSINVHVDHRIPEWVMGDDSRLSQIFLNILSNAVKFTYSGGIIIHVLYQPCEQGRDMVKTSIRDTGIGVKEEQVETIFDEFTQANMSINREFGGTGLGLSITKRLVDAMEGTIDLRSTYGEGTIVNVTLPIERAHQKRRHLDCEIKMAVITSQVDKYKNVCLQLNRMGIEVKVVQVIDGLSREEEYEYVLIDWEQRLAEIDVLMPMVKNRVGVGVPIEIVSYYRDPKIQKLIESSEQVSVLFLPMSSDKLIKHIAEKQKQDQEHTLEEMSDMEAINGKMILVVEDNDLNQDIERSILEDKGGKVVIARNGLESIEIVKENNEFDLILMDIHMPVMDGYDAAKEIRKMASYVNVPIIAMTADVQVGVEEKVKASGMNDYIRKPINVMEVYKVLAKWL